MQPLPEPSAAAGVVDHEVFVVHAEDDTPFVKGELLPMLGLPDDRVILASELPFPAFTEQAIEDSVRRSRLTLAVVSPAYLRDRRASFADERRAEFARLLQAPTATRSETK